MGLSLGFLGVLAVFFSFEEGKHLARGPGGLRKEKLMLQPQGGTILASPPVWVSHTSSRWVIPAGKSVAAPGGLEGKEGTFSWILVSLRGVPTPPGAGGTPSHVEGLRFVLVTPNSSWRAETFGFSSFPGGIPPGFFPAENQGCLWWPWGTRGGPGERMVALGDAWWPQERVVATLCCSCPVPAPSQARPWDVPGREALPEERGNECGGGGELCPRQEQNVPAQLPALPTLPLRVWDDPAAADLEFSRRNRVGEGRGKSGSLEEWKAFPFGMLSLVESQKSGPGSGRLGLVGFCVP